MTHKLSTRITAILAVAATLLLSGCGGGAVATLLAEVGSGGTGRVLGVLSGFGSMIVDGMRRDDTRASYMSEEDQGPASAMASTGMMLGHSLELSLDANDNIASVMVSPELLGTVSGVAANDITVLGTKVTINKDTAAGPITALLGYASPTAIQIGDRVVVYGLLKTDSLGVTSLQATLIAQKTSGTGVRLTGYVTQYNAAAGTFVIGNHTVSTGSATLSPAGTSLSNGQLVTVWSNTPTVGTAMSASTIRIKGPSGISGTLTLSGPISGYVSAASFKIRSTTVDATNATLLPSGTNLSDSKYVVAVGKYDAATNKLTATSVTHYAPAASSAVELHGTILNLVSPSSFTVRGTVVDASSATVTGGTLAQLSNGVFVNVFGAISNNQVKAATIRIVALNPLNAPAGAMLDLMGTISSYDSTSGRYTMTTSSGTVIGGATAPSMFYSNGTVSNLAIGQVVNVRGTMSNNALSTSVMSFTQMPAMPAAGMTYLEGTASNVTATSFELNGMTIQRNGVPVQGGGNGMMGNSGMMGGSRLNVSVQFSGGQYVATAITVLGG